MPLRKAGSGWRSGVLLAGCRIAPALRHSMTGMQVTARQDIPETTTGSKHLYHMISRTKSQFLDEKDAIEGNDARIWSYVKHGENP